MINKKIIIDIPFNVKNHPFYPEFQDIVKDSHFIKSMSKEWIDYRINIFMNYCALGLMNQSNQSFLCIVRYEESTKSLVFNALSKYPKLPDNIIFTCDGDNLIKDVLQYHEYIYHVRLDSDNIYHSNYIEEIDKFEYYQGLQCILCQSGYVYDIKDNRLAKIYHPSPSFYTLIYRTDEFINGFRHYVERDHWGARKLNHKILEGRLYMITTHKTNVMNQFNGIINYFSKIGYTEEIINDLLKETILKEWKI